MRVESRLKRIEKQLGIDRDKDIIELPLPNGRIGWMTQHSFDKFVAWLNERANYGK